jgi:hypothetical protein
MEISQGNSLFSCLYLKQAKMSCFCFYVFSFFFYKIRTGGWNKSCAEGGQQERGADADQDKSKHSGKNVVYTYMKMKNRNCSQEKT